MILPVKPYLQEKGSFINLEGDILKIKEVVYDDNIYVKDNICKLDYFIQLRNVLWITFRT